MKATWVAVSLVLMVLAGCATPPPEASVSTALPPPAGLLETYWKAVELAGNPVPPGDIQSEAYLVLSAEGTEGAPQLLSEAGALHVRGNTGCNRLTASYTADAHNLRFSALAVTRMACPAGAAEPAFLQALEATRRYRIGMGQSDELELLDAAGRVLGRFHPTFRR